MIELAIVPTRLRRSVRISSVMKCELIPRSRSTTERRKFMCRSRGAFSRMRAKADAIDAPEDRGLRGRRLRGARLAVDQRHFAEKIARLNEAERLLLAAATDLRDPHRALDDEIKAVARFAFVEDHIVEVEMEQVDIGTDIADQSRRDSRKEPVSLEASQKKGSSRGGKPWAQHLLKRRSIAMGLPDARTRRESPSPLALAHR